MVIKVARVIRVIRVRVIGHRSHAASKNTVRITRFISGVK